MARNTLATVLDLDGKSDEALRGAARMLAVKPNYADARYLVGKILLARGDAADAIEQLEVAARSRPKTRTSTISSGRHISGWVVRSLRRERSNRTSG